jgi:aminopeptidase N
MVPIQWKSAMFYMIMAFIFASINDTSAQSTNHSILDSGRFPLPEQLAYNVRYYDLDIELFPDRKAIAGAVTIVADVVHPMDGLVLDLDTTFTVLKVTVPDNSWRIRDGGDTGPRRSLHKASAEPLSTLGFEHKDGQLRITNGRTWQPGQTVIAQIHYEGSPRIAPNPPWDGGFSWDITPDGHPWIGVSCQTIGADVWWPVKDHPSDRPDSVAIHITVPDPLFAASNGRHRGTSSNGDGTSTYHWFVSTPISNYNVTVNAGPYTVIEDYFVSVAGDTMGLYFWVLPEDVDRAVILFPQFAAQLRFFEELLGPYPFRADKYGVVQSSYLGMEHQTLIAYGAGFRNDRLFNMNTGYDDLHHHELAHEWWGNLVAVYDWKDFWIHEGLATYMQALYTEQVVGRQRYLQQMRLFRSFVQNRTPIAPLESQSSRQMYQGRDIYYKGAVVLHSLRYLIGDDDFFRLLRLYAYPDPELEKTVDGSAMRFTSTEEFRALSERVTGKSLSWFYDVYLHQTALPVLHVTSGEHSTVFEWEVPGGGEFFMPVPVRVGVEGEISVISMQEGRAVLLHDPDGQEFEIDPEGWLLFRMESSPEHP